MTNIDDWPNADVRASHNLATEIMKLLHPSGPKLAGAALAQAFGIFLAVHNREKWKGLTAAHTSAAKGIAEVYAPIIGVQAEAIRAAKRGKA